MLDHRPPGLSGSAHDREKVPPREGQFFYENYLEIRVKNFKAVLMFKYLRNNTFSLNDTLCLELKGTAKLPGVVFHTSFLSRFKAITPRRTTGCRCHCLDLLNKEQFNCFEALYQANCCKSIAFWRRRLEIPPMINKKAFAASYFVFR